MEEGGKKQGRNIENNEKRGVQISEREREVRFKKGQDIRQETKRKCYAKEIEKCEKIGEAKREKQEAIRKKSRKIGKENVNRESDG